MYHLRTASPFTTVEQRRTIGKPGRQAIELFVVNELAARVESANAYVANEHPGCLHDCIFLICDDCGKATHVDNDGVTGGVRDVAKGAGFAPKRPVIEVRGTCGDCAD